jgi:peptidoglycan/xylan/chitin deacetylase (PgdA/CDA1 family)
MEAKDHARFRRTLRMLRNAFEFVSLAEAVRLLREADAPTGRYLAFSFDDGYRDNYDLVAPLLVEVGASACFFVSTGFIDCDEVYRRHFLRSVVGQSEDRHPMSWSMLRELAASGFEIGAHTIDHPNLASIERTEAERQVIEAAAEVERRIGSDCRWFAWPFGTDLAMPNELLSRITHRFDGTFSAIRSRKQYSYGGRVINRDHFEPSWPSLHVRYFAFRAMSQTRVAA